MTEQDKQLLLKDLCARLPYGFNAEIVDIFGYTGKIHISVDTLPALDKSILLRCKPYLRPMSSMTKEEQKEFVGFHCVNLCPIVMDSCLTINNEVNMIDWLNAHHFDYRGLIEKGLALEAPENMYK